MLMGLVKRMIPKKKNNNNNQEIQQRWWNFGPILQGIQNNDAEM